MRAANTLVALAGSLRCAGCRRAESGLCPSCRKLLRPPAPATVPGVTRVVCAWEYEGPPRALILNLKLRGDRAAAGPLVEGVLAAARRSGLAGETVTWVPGRPAGIRERGFDHAALLAAGVARELGLPACSLLRRRRAVSDQSELSAADRRINLENAFAAEACTGGIVLVDDLLTTGSTAEACARALREAGAAFVELLAPCRRS